MSHITLHHSRLSVLHALPSWSVSATVHFAVIVTLACLYVDQQQQRSQVFVSAKNLDGLQIIEDLLDQLPPIDVTQTVLTSDVVTSVNVTDNTFVEPTDNFTPEAAFDSPVDMEQGFAHEIAPDGILKSIPGGGGGTLKDGRGNAGTRVTRYRSVGCTEAGEAAVAKALKWLGEHQLPDGGWSFDHRVAPNCQGKCSHGGELKDCRTGATALALLTFLGAGQTHKEGTYKRTVDAGLYFLVQQMKVNQAERRGDLAQGGGNMYAHGLAAIVLCEAYDLTHDKSLAAPAQFALNHIVYAQDPIGGGWRYNPRQAGDTSVVGWQLMALKSGHLAYLNVPKETIAGTTKFLDSVQTESGAKYGYTTAGAGSATTAVGLLCRMYLGWKPDHPALERGVEYLSQTGPSKTNMYYNYYASQVLRHLEGERWDKWNRELSPFLVESQEKAGHEAGSWHFTGDHGSSTGGRLYCTAMATMILEVYYRHLPIFGKSAAEDDFKL